MEKKWPNNIIERSLVKKKYLNKNDIKNIKIKINDEINESFNYAKKSDFPNINSFEDLNLSKKTLFADKILKEVGEKFFDVDQKVILPKGY